MLNKNAFTSLYQIAERQQGCFTARQARKAGYSTQGQYYHVHNGDWQKLDRGIFRLNFFPRGKRLDLMTIYLWSCDGEGSPQGVYSHDTAFSLFPYSVWNPEETHMTVRPGFRKRGQEPEGLVLYKDVVPPSEITWLHGVPVTKPVRTVVHLLQRDFLEKHHLVDFLRTSFAEGLITHAELMKVDLSLHEWNLLVPLLERLRYDRLEEIRQSRRLQA